MNRELYTINEQLSTHINKYSDALYRYIFISMKHNLYTDDIVQETFIKLYHELQKNTEINNFKAWLFTTAHRTMIDTIRREKSRHHISTDYHSDFIEKTIPTKQLTNYQDHLRDIHVLLESCGITKSENKRLMILHMVFDFTLEELSVQFKEKPNTLAVRLKRLRKKFIHKYEQSHTTIEKSNTK